MRPFSLAVSLLLYTTLSAAWPWPPSIHNINMAIARRQNNDNSSKTSAAASSTAEPSKTAAASTASKTESNDSKETGKKTSGTAAESTQASKTSGKHAKTTKTSKTKSISIDPAGSPGLVSMVEPAQTSTTYIKIGEDVTFKWNYTGLIASPSKLDVIATNTEGSTWTIAQNMSMEATGSVVWDTGDATPSLGMEKYGFIVYDAEAGPSATVEAGHLAPLVNPYQFALYSPREAQGTGKSFCVTCSAAVTATERQSMRVLLLVATLTVLSFTYFTCGFLGL